MKQIGYAALAACALALNSPNHARASAFETLYTFTDVSSGALPQAGLVVLNGIFYGTTALGGINPCPSQLGCGNVFKFDPATGTETVLYNFNPGKSGDGYEPLCQLIVYNGILYGTTIFGGTNGGGTIFKIDPETGAEKVLYSFQQAEQPQAGLTLYRNKFYGTTTNGGLGQYGTIFEFDPANSNYKLLHDFDLLDGWLPLGVLEAHEGVLYGTTHFGGNTDNPQSPGTVFSYNLDTGITTVVHDFAGNGIDDGEYSDSGVTYHQGTLYGAVTGLPPSTYRIDIATGAFSLVHSFEGPNQGGNVYPNAEPLFLRGFLYGSTNGVGTKNSGTIYKTDPVTGATTVLHRFTAFPGNTNPNISVSNLIFYNGRLYGTATPVGYDAAAVHGSIFSIKP